MKNLLNNTDPQMMLSRLQHLPSRERAALTLLDVLDWRSDEVAELLDQSVQSVEDALGRARSALIGQ